MKLSEIYNCKIILADDLEILKKNNVVTDGVAIITFIGEENHQKKIYNFYNLLDYKLHSKFSISSKSISEEFHESLPISLALKKKYYKNFLWSDRIISIL